jgi:hypothetical protein
MKKLLLAIALVTSISPATAGSFGGFRGGGGFRAAPSFRSTPSFRPSYRPSYRPSAPAYRPSAPSTFHSVLPWAALLWWQHNNQQQQQAAPATPNATSQSDNSSTVGWVLFGLAAFAVFVFFFFIL